MAEDENEKEEAQDNSAEEGGGDESSEGGGKKKLIIIAAIAVVLLLGGGGAIFFFLSGDSSEQSAEVAAEEGDSDESEDAESTEGEDSKEKEESAEGEAVENKEEKVAEGDGAKKKGEAEGKTDTVSDIDFGFTYQMKTFNVNLGNALENRFVRMEVSLEYSDEENGKLEIEKRQAQLRDAVISVVRRKTREFLLAPDGKDALRKEILIRINRYMKYKIDQVYITDILIE